MLSSENKTTQDHWESSWNIHRFELRYIYTGLYKHKGEQTFATLKLSHWWKVISNKVQPCTNIRYIRDDHQYWKLRKQCNKKVQRLCLQSTRQIINVVEKQAQSNGVFFCNRIQYKQPRVYPNGSWASSKPRAHISTIRLAWYTPRALDMQRCRTQHPWRCTAMLKQLAAAPSNMNCLNRVNINMSADTLVK